MRKGNFFFIYPDEAYHEFAVQNLTPLNDEFVSHLHKTLTNNNLEIIKNFLNTETLYINSTNQLPFHENFYVLNESLNVVNIELEDEIERIASQSKYNFFINPCGFGLNEEMFEKIFTLLEVEDDVTVYFEADDFVTLLAFNSFDKSFLSLMSSRRKKEFKNFLATEKLLFRFDNFRLIKRFEDIKNLYRFLSKKESVPFCSQKIHEEFTQIFIEYKEFLN